MKVFRKAATFFKLERSQRGLAAAAIAWLWAVRLGLWMLPFRTLQRWSEFCARPVRGDRPSTVQQIAWAIELASRYVPRATCLSQALATRILLGRNDIPGRFHIGVALDGNQRFQAHAWMESQGVVVCGGAEAGNHTPILVHDSLQQH